MSRSLPAATSLSTSEPKSRTVPAWQLQPALIAPTPLNASGAYVPSGLNTSRSSAVPGCRIIPVWFQFVGLTFGSTRFTGPVVAGFVTRATLLKNERLRIASRSLMGSTLNFSIEPMRWPRSPIDMPNAKPAS